MLKFIFVVRKSDHNSFKHEFIRDVSIFLGLSSFKDFALFHAKQINSIHVFERISYFFKNLQSLKISWFSFLSAKGRRQPEGFLIFHSVSGRMASNKVRNSLKKRYIMKFMKFISHENPKKSYEFHDIQKFQKFYEIHKFIKYIKIM